MAESEIKAETGLLLLRQLGYTFDEYRPWQKERIISSFKDRWARTYEKNKGDVIKTTYDLFSTPPHRHSPITAESCAQNFVERFGIFYKNTGLEGLVRFGVPSFSSLCTVLGGIVEKAARETRDYIDDVFKDDTFEIHS